MATEGLRDLEQEAWRGFLLTHDRLWRALEAGLASLNVSMAEYSVLATLDAAGPNGMRMSDLAQSRLMSSGGFTRLADRLESRGLIERRRSAVDGRGFDAVLTDSGRTCLREARRRHHGDLRELFFSRLDDDHLRDLVDVWNRLDPAVGADDEDTPC
ncbi:MULTISPECIES: MarR family winged helix-turn-helix transcriptional regulator [Nocardiopsis]|nr:MULTISPECIES: MarR family transcriptional regulator [Nocardiopsis]